MAQVIVAVATVDSQLPDGVQAGQMRISLSTADGVVASQDVDGAQATFDGVAPGSYTATAQALDSTGANLGSAVSQDFVVPAPAMFQQPVSITVSLG